MLDIVQIEERREGISVGDDDSGDNDDNDGES
jgi:hypothetical protein